MAIQGRKISQFNAFPLEELTGDEMLMIAYNGKTYRLPVSTLTGNAIQSITQIVDSCTDKNGNPVDKDRQNNPVTIVFGSGNKREERTFNIYNGAKGSKGDPGDPGEIGPEGNSGVAIYNQAPEDFIFNGNLDEETEEILSELALSAALGYKLNEDIEKLREVYMTQEEYDALTDEEIDENTKYFIYEE